MAERLTRVSRVLEVWWQIPDRPIFTHRCLGAMTGSWAPQTRNKSSNKASINERLGLVVDNIPVPVI